MKEKQTCQFDVERLLFADDRNIFQCHSGTDVRSVFDWNVLPLEQLEGATLIMQKLTSSGTVQVPLPVEKERTICSCTNTDLSPSQSRYQFTSHKVYRFEHQRVWFLWNGNVWQHSAVFQGASLGCAVGTAFTLWVGFGSYSIDRHLSKLPTNTANCTESLLLNSSAVAHSGSHLFPTTTIMPETHEL